jgi:hypothetical protein
MTDSLRHYRSVLSGSSFRRFSLPPASASTVTLSIKNDDTHALRCMVVFAHWITTDFSDRIGQNSQSQ